MNLARQLGAELVLGWRRAVRGPLVVALAAVLVLAVGVWPGRVDEGLVRTGYGIALGWGMLLVCALWCGGTAYALDRERRRLTLTFCKPLARLTLWWGRCLGTWLPFAALVVLMWGLLLGRALPEGRHVQAPELPDLEAQAQHELAELRASGALPKVSEARLLRAVRTDILGRYTELSATEPRTYTFAGHAEAARGDVTFRLSGTPFLGAKDALELAVAVSCGGRSAELRPAALRDTGFTLTLPEGLVQAGAPVILTLKRLDSRGAASVFYRERADLALLFPGVPGWVNLTAFCAVVLVTLALAVALGTALGCCFSLPVTLFVGTVAIVAAASASLSPETMVADEVATVWSRASATISWVVAGPFRDLVALNPLQALLGGEAIAPERLLRLIGLTALPWMVLCSLAALLSPVRDEDL